MNTFLNKHSLARLLFLACCVTYAIDAAAQTTTPSRSYDANRTVNYGFVSPNTREGLKLQDAISNLSSAEESGLIRKSNLMRCRMRTSIKALRSLGSWSDGAEHSVLLRMQGDEPTIRYVVSSLGRDAKQKAVLYFHRRTSGSARLYIFSPARRIRLTKLAAVLDEAGINFRTLVPLRRGTIIYVVDEKRELQLKVMTAAKRLKANISSQNGTAEFIGSDNDREQAASVFAKEIMTYESAHPALPAICKDDRVLPPFTNTKNGNEK